PVPIPVFLEDNFTAPRLGTALHLEAALEDLCRAILRYEKLCAAEVHSARDGLGVPVGARHPADPLPVDAPAPPVRHKTRAVLLFQAELENAGDAFVHLEVAHPDALLEIYPLGAKCFPRGHLFGILCDAGERKPVLHRRPLLHEAECARPRTRMYSADMFKVGVRFPAESRLIS